MLNHPKRLRFNRGSQEDFLLAAKGKLSLKWKEMASLLKISEGTLKSYRNEYCTLPYSIFAKVCSSCGWSLNPASAKYGAKESTNIGKARLKLHSQTLCRNRSMSLQIPDSIAFLNDKNCTRLPNFLSEELAEEMGIHLGDGFLSEKRFNFRVKGNRENERNYYDRHLSELYFGLYGIKLKNKDYGACYGFEISSKKLWLFKTKVLGLRPGKKDSISIPKIIKSCSGKILCSFLRGLLDTDGCLEFRSRYGKNEYYPVISLSCKSQLLANDVFISFKSLGLAPRIYRTLREESVIYLYGYENFSRYEKIIGWSQPKNKTKLSSFRERWSNLHI